MSAGTSDPTMQLPAGPGPEEAGSWDISLAEIDAMGRKAARGAGLDWGLAEEAGRAARWLAAHGGPGPEALLSALGQIDGDAARYRPQPGPVWRAEAGPLCPVATGAALSDRAERIAVEGTVRLGPVIVPVLLIPFLCAAGRTAGCGLRVEGAGPAVSVTPGGVLPLDWEAFPASTADEIRIVRDDALTGAPLAPGPGPRRVALTVWRGLDRFAQRTYVPASEGSRAGAGAGLRDND